MSKEQPWWKIWLSQGKDLGMITEEFLERQIGDEPSQEELTDSHKQDLKKWSQMNREELEQERSNNMSLVKSLQESPDYQEGGNVSHLQWSLNALNSLLEKTTED